MSKSEELRYGAPGENALHICVDMQRMFAESTEWKMPWLPRVLPNVVAIASAYPERTIFTRFSFSLDECQNYLAAAGYDATARKML